MVAAKLDESPQGIEATVSDALPGRARCHVRDPFGSRIELIESDP